jgi:hypothetical protein
MGYFSEHSGIGANRNFKVSELTPIQDGLDTFKQGFGRMDDLWDNLKNMAGNVPVIGGVLEGLLDNPAINAIEYAFGIAKSITSGLAIAFKGIEPLLQPLYHGWLQAMGQDKTQGSEQLANIDNFFNTPGAYENSRGAPGSGVDWSQFDSPDDSGESDYGIPNIYAVVGLIGSPNVAGSIPQPVAVR